MRLNLRTKLIGCFVSMLLLMVVVGLVGMYTSNRIQNHLEDTVEQDVKAANTLGVVARRVGFIHSNSLLHLITKSIEDMNRYESEIADWEGKISTDLDTLENTFKDQETLDKLAEVRAAWDTYLRIWHEQIVPLSRASRDEEAFALARKNGAAGTAAREAMYELDELHGANVAAASHSLELAERDFRKSQNILLAVTLLATIFGLAFGIKQSSLIAGAVNAVSKAAQLVAAGDLDQSVVVRTGDEIESMADSFNKMTGNMKKMVKELRHEITERTRAEAEIARLAKFPSENPNPVLRVAKDGTIIYANEASLPLLNVWGSQEGQPLPDDWRGFVLDGLSSGLSEEVEAEYEDRILSLTFAPVVDADYANVYGLDITERKRAEETIRHLAYHDALTGLPNRILFNDRLNLALAHAHRSQQKLAVMLLDLDQFKEVNDRLGHGVGDQLLQAVSERLASLLRSSDTVARMGGDEFMMLLPEIAGKEDAASVAQKILEDIRQPFEFDGHELHISTSIGIALYPDDGEDRDTLMKNADIAMYSAKDQGRDNYQRYTPAVDVKALE